MSLNYGNSTVSTKISIPVINWAAYNNRANTDSAIAAEPAVGQCLFARYFSAVKVPAPSLLIVPARFKDSKLYSQIPTNGSGDFTVVRADNTATRVNSSGNIQIVNANIPRLDYFVGGVVGCPALLVEPSAQNLLLRSEEFSVSGTGIGTWDNNSSGTLVSANTAIAPNGTTTADTIQDNTGSSNDPWLLQTFAGTAGSTYTFSVYLRADTSMSLRLWIYDNIIGSGAASLLTVAVSTTWTRFTFTRTISSGATFMRVGFLSNISTNPFYAWGAQLETGSVATSYIPTTTGSVTRNADVISVSGAVSGSIGQTEGTICASINVSKLLNTTQRAIVDVGQSGNRIFIGYGNLLTNQIRFLLQTSSGGLVDFQSAATTTGTIKIAVGYKNFDSAMYINGISIAPLSNDSFTSTLTTLSNIYLGSSLSSGDFLNDSINLISLHTTRLTNQQLQALTA